MASFKEFMETDHKRLDSLMAEYQKAKNSDAEKAKQIFSEYFSSFERHMKWEEEILFPIYEAKSGMGDMGGPSAMMRMEHNQIRSFLNDMKTRVEANDFGTQYLEDEMAGILGVHNKSEEEILYPMLDKMVNEQEKAEAFAKIEAKK